MSYKATVYNIMISAPGDAAIEVATAARLVKEWDTLHSKERKIKLNPLHWSTDYFADSRDFPQDGINKQLVSNADILLAIFKHRIGSSTGIHPSGTCEEIAIAREFDIPVAIYFSSEEPADNADMEQWNSLCAYRQSLKAKPDRTGSAYSEYSNLAQLKELLRLAINTAVTQLAQNDNEKTKSTEITISITNPADQQVADLDLSKQAKLVLLSAITSDGRIIAAPNSKTITSGGITFSNYGITREAVEELKNDGFIHEENSELGIFLVAPKLKAEQANFPLDPFASNILQQACSGGGVIRCNTWINDSFCLRFGNSSIESDGDPKEEMKLRKALSDLESQGMLKPQDSTRKHFEVTSKGYHIFEQLEKCEPNSLNTIQNIF